MSIKIALATVADSRLDFFARRKDLVEEELENLGWLRNDSNIDVIESGVIRSNRDVNTFAEEAMSFGAQSLVVHIPIWADPILTIKLCKHVPLPVLLLGNSRPETSSIVGLLGAGGALGSL